MEKSLLQLLRQLRHLLKQIPNQPNIRNLEDRRIGILVDRSNNLTILHTRQVLNSTRDTRTQVQLRCDVLTRLSDLQTVIREATVHSSTGSTDGSAQCISQGNDDAVKLLLGLETTTTRDDAGSGTKVRTLGLGELLGHPFGLGGGVGVDAFSDGGAAAGGLDALEGGAADSEDLDGVGGLDGQDGVAGVDGADEGCSLLC